MVVPKIGVLALQGDVSEHVLAMKTVLGGRGDVLEVRKPGQMDQCQALVLPGGESTTISQQLVGSGLTSELIKAAALGKPILATCAGLVIVSKGIEGDSKVKPLGLMDIEISRNAFGSQRESFEADLKVVGMKQPYRAVFIRAPAITKVGRGVETLAHIGSHVVAARQNNLLALAFHPELTNDMRFHQLFLKMLEA